MTDSPLRAYLSSSVLVALTFTMATIHTATRTNADEPKVDAKPDDYATAIRPLLKTYCLNCHSAKVKKGSLDLERFTTLADARDDLKVWQGLIEQLEAGEMPPKGKPQPTADEKKRLVEWARGFLEVEAKARTGDPGRVPLRRLSNAEYNYTIRDLTGVDLQPAKEFPADGAAGEGFTNAAESLTDISPALLTKYLNAAKDIADHVVLLPDGFRFSKSRTRRDWTDEETATLRAFYARFAPADGRLIVQPYLAATVQHRAALTAGKFDEVAAKTKLNAKYLRAVWSSLTDRTHSEPLDTIRAKWRGATEADIPSLVATVAAWQEALWRTARVGSYVRTHWGASDTPVESLTRQVPFNLPPIESVPLRTTVRLSPGQHEATIYLAAREAGTNGRVVWSHPRFEAKGKPTLLLSDYAKYGPAFEVDYPSAFASSSKYLAAVVALANDRALTLESAAKQYGLNMAFLKRWSEVLAIEPFTKDASITGRAVPAVELTLLEEKTIRNGARPVINGWHKKGTDLPVLVTNSSDKVEEIPGRIPAKGVGVHPMPKEFVAVVWTAPVSANVKVSAKVIHAHPACGNGVAYWIEHRRRQRAAVFAEGAIDLGGEVSPHPKTRKVEKGDQIILAVDAKDANHVCDMTAITFTLSETEKPGRVWDLAADVVTSVLDGNPHADGHGNKDVWSFVRGPSRSVGKGIDSAIPSQSVLGKWRNVASDPKLKDMAAELAQQVQTLLSGTRPTKASLSDRMLYDNLVGVQSKLLMNVDVAQLAKPRADGPFALAMDRFTKSNIVAPSHEVVAIRLPAALLVGREFVVDARLDGPAGERLVRPTVATTPPVPGAQLAGPLLGSSTAAPYRQLIAGHDAFRKVFPLFICFPHVVPTDEVVCLKMFHREDEPLVRLFLTDEQAQKLDRLWREHRFISRQPVAEYDYLPQFMGFTTQDTPKAFQQFFIDRKPLFKKHADEFLKDETVAISKQLDRLLAFAERAYRRPLQPREKAELRSLYETIRAKGAPHAEAFRGVLARILVAPAFLFRIEHSPKGKMPGAVNDWELATRLSYFLWSSLPDEELRTLAESKKLRDPVVLASQVQRMLKDEKAQSLAVEFGTQWIHVRGFDTFDEKNERMFPVFNYTLRNAIYQETIHFFLDFFRNDRPILSLLDADYAFLNETLARHYGIPGVKGDAFRKVDGVRKYGRGGVLGFASVQAKQSGASRTSPILRGTWVVETLLGEKLPAPPPDVPQLPEVEGADKLTTRQLVERHVSVPACATCHIRIDPFGFALEKYDAIGRLREKEVSGLPVDAKSKLKDGTEFEGIDGLRNYLLSRKKDVIVRLFCRRLLGYALGRAVTLSDTSVLDEMVAALNKNKGRVGAAVQVIVQSKQFRMVRGSEFGE